MLPDLILRGEAVKLPALLKIAKSQQHPLRGDAADKLELFLDADFKNDWNKWEAALNARLAKQQQAKPEARGDAPAPASAK